MLLLISHDRDFLDQIVSHIVHIEHQTLQIYTGNYQAFEELRAAHLAQHQANYQKQQQQIAHIQSFVTRFRAKASKAKQAQSRLNALARIEQIAPAHVDSPFNFTFQPCDKMPSPLITFDCADIGYQQTTILRDINFALSPGDRIGLLGANGAGKSTFIKALAGTIELQTGQRHTAQDIKMGYFAQHQLEQLDSEQSPLQLLQQLNPQASESELRQFLGGFNFRNETALGPIAPLSGGEKARLVLALIVYQRPNALLLDEPTNHLDLDMRHALTIALQAFQGAVVVISHDRHLLRTICDELYLIANHSLTVYNGDLTDYQNTLTQLHRNKPSTTDTTTPSPTRKSQRRLDAQTRQQSQPIRKEIKQLEHQLQTLTDAKQAVDTQLTDSAVYSPDNKKLLKELIATQVQIEKQLKHTEDAWLSASETLELFEKNLNSPTNI